MVIQYISSAMGANEDGPRPGESKLEEQQRMSMLISSFVVLVRTPTTHFFCSLACHFINVVHVWGYISFPGPAQLFVACSTATESGEASSKAHQWPSSICGSGYCRFKAVQIEPSTPPVQGKTRTKSTCS